MWKLVCLVMSLARYLNAFPGGPKAHLQEPTRGTQAHVPPACQRRSALIPTLLPVLPFFLRLLHFGHRGHRICITITTTIAGGRGDGDGGIPINHPTCPLPSATAGISISEHSPPKEQRPHPPCHVPHA